MKKINLNIQLFAYQKTEWKDLPDTSTPITADKLNNIESGIVQNETDIIVMQTSIQTAKEELSNEINDKNNNIQLMLFGSQNIPIWTANKDYAIGDICINNLIIYKCKEATNDETFDESKWDIIPLFNIPTDESSEDTSEEVIEETS